MQLQPTLRDNVLSRVRAILMRPLSKAAFLLVAVTFSLLARADTAADLKLCTDFNTPAVPRVEACTRVIASSPDAHEVFRAYANRAQGHFLNARSDKALPDIDHAIELEPENATAHLIRGNMYYSHAEYDKSAADLSVFLELYPDDVGVLRMRATSYSALGKDDLAIADYDSILRADPDDADAFYGRGLRYEAIGELTRARADFERAIQLDRTYTGDFHATCFGVELFSDAPRRELINWPACEREQTLP
jgi:tetratricopeptide (TPR) repeat protein